MLGDMYKADVLKIYKTSTAVAQALGITVSAVSQWEDLVPPISAAKLAQLNSTLSFDPALYPDLPANQRHLLDAFSATQS